jgi:hypothetical protein
MICHTHTRTDFPSLGSLSFSTITITDFFPIPCDDHDMSPFGVRCHPCIAAPIVILSHNVIKCSSFALPTVTMANLLLYFAFLSIFKKASPHSALEVQRAVWRLPLSIED